VYGYKDGKGTSGDTSGLCETCLEKRLKKLK
jgi:hypothetical protein